MRIAFLGLGKMGSAIAGNLIDAGHELRVWNRTRAHAEALAKRGARVANSATEAVAGVDVVFSMLFDDAALEEVMFSGGALKAMMPGTVHVSLSTISVALSDRLTIMHRTEHLTLWRLRCLAVRTLPRRVYWRRLLRATRRRWRRYSRCLIASVGW